MDWKDKGKVQDGIITWYCCALAEKITIYGRCPPSRTPEVIDWQTLKNTHSFRVVDGDLRFKDNYGQGYYENLNVRGAELPSALKAIEAMG